VSNEIYLPKNFNAPQSPDTALTAAGQLELEPYIFQAQEGFSSIFLLLNNDGPRAG